MTITHLKGNLFSETPEAASNEISHLEEKQVKQALENETRVVQNGL